MPASDIVIKGAREHNLRDVSLTIPRNQLICFTGVSGSGKSSLAFDTLYAEGQRRYVESLSTFARQFLGQMPKPDVDLISGLSPSISISQKTSGRNPRSTVGTITEIYDYLRVLLARVGHGFCPQCDRRIEAQSREQIITRILQLPPDSKFSVLAPIIRGQKGEHRDLFEDLLKQGFVRARVDGAVVSLSDELKLDRQMRHDIEVVIDRLVNRDDTRPRLAEAVELALKIGKGNLIVTLDDGHPPPKSKKASPSSREPKDLQSDEDQELDFESTPSVAVKERTRARSDRTGDILFSSDYACTSCGISFEPPSPQLFSFNSPQGMCLRCDGLGAAHSFDPDLLVPNPKLSFKEGCIVTVGPWKELGRWRRHIYQGVSDAMGRKWNLASGAMLELPWKELSPEARNAWLWGTGNEHISFTWRGGVSPIMYGGKFDGIIPELTSKRNSSKSAPQIRQLESLMRIAPCTECHGARLNPQARSIRITSRHAAFQGRATLSLPEICGLSIADAVSFFTELELDETESIIAAEVLKEIRGRLGFLMNVGLDYLTLDRTAPTLSGGESQRIRLAGQIGAGLVGVIYILDEPSIGLHPRDNDRLINTLTRLRDMGNTVVVVEHDEDTMRASDHIIDFGPGAGVRGGEVVAAGPIQTLVESDKSVTGKFLAGKLRIDVPEKRRTPDKRRLVITGATHNNLKNVDIEIPLGVFVCVTGVSGSGKSSLVNDILAEVLHRDLNKGEGTPGTFASIKGIEQLDKLIAIDQSPIGRIPRSNPGTYIKVFDDIRNLFSQLPDAKQRGFKTGRFSFNVKGGRCEACEGNGSNRLEMDFLADVWVTCPVCEGHRYNRETLSVKFKGKSISDVLEMDVQQLLELFENVPHVHHKLKTLHDVGLDYIKLGQPSPTLSGGEAQRIKLARELVKKTTGKTLYLLDEPTTGLHFADVKLLLNVLHNFADQGNTVLVVEHNLDVIKTADWIIDMGPEGGAGGGEVIAVGTPEDIIQNKRSFTGQSLAPLLGGRSKTQSAGKGRTNRNKQRIAETREIVVQGARQHNLKDVSVRIGRDEMTVFCGPSGSGKSSLAMDTIYAEGQRRYVESLSSYARQFVSQMQKPVVDHVDGLSPAIAIEQKNLGHTPRSTVGTVTEIYDYLRILMARLGQPNCPACDVPVGTQTADEIIDKILQEPEGTRLYLMAPMEIEVGEEYAALWAEIRAAGYQRIRIDGQTHSLDSPPEIDRRRKHRVEVVVDRVTVRPDARSRIAGSVENILAYAKGRLHVAYVVDNIPEPRWETVIHSQHLACHRCGRSFEPLTPHSFSFNSPLGWCPTCNGLAVQIGANPAALLKSPKMTLREGGVLLWPNLSISMSMAMLEALSRGTGIQLDTPLDQLSARHRKLLMHGCGEDWFSVSIPNESILAEGLASKKAQPENPGLEPLTFQFQFKGLYPALDEAARLSYILRARFERFIGEVECAACGGSRLRDDAGAVRFRGRTIDEYCRLPLGEFNSSISNWKLTSAERKIAGELIREIQNRTQFLVDVGLSYLSLSRPAITLSNGEAQRIRLASQLGSGLCGVLYVLDEPTIGLHPRDNRRLLNALHRLRDLGNTLLVVEHDREVIAEADQVCDFGPGAGRRGGQIVAQGAPSTLGQQRGSVTGPYLNGSAAIPVISNRRVPKGLGSATGSPDAPIFSNGRPTIQIIGARHNNLRDVRVAIPLGTLTAVTGVSGSGKSSLIDDVLYPILARSLHRASLVPGAHDSLRGLEHINKVIRVDQQPLGNSPSSNPATYTGAFELIRALYAQLPDAKVRGFTGRRFSFNVPGGRCEACEGNGQRRIEMHFLPDVWVECDTCRGKRYNPETLAVTYHGRSISDVLDLTCGDAVTLFKNIPKIRKILQTLCDVGLDYLTLGQPAPTLSGGEAQRVKLAAELSRPDTGQTLYLLDEPTTGLHFDDLAKLLEVLHRLVDLGNTVVVIEHNLDVIKQADWIIDMGPEAGDAGGKVVGLGTPEELVEGVEAGKPARNKGKRAAAVRDTSTLASHTARALAPILAQGPYQQRLAQIASALQEQAPGDLDITEVGSSVKMPWEVDGRGWHTKDRVGRNGEACRWDGKILAQVVDRIHSLGDFSATDWNSRSVVEICAERKSDGWFFHAITGETYLLKMKFRVYRSAFDRKQLDNSLGLKTPNQLEDLPVYGNEPRVTIRSAKGPWQEVEIRAYKYDEIDTPEFWGFLESAVKSFLAFFDRPSLDMESLTPWKKLGQKWHMQRKGFPPGRKVIWESELLEELFTLLSDAAPDGQFLWNNQQLVHLYLPGQRLPWITVHTKRPEHLQMTLTGPKNAVALGRVAEIGSDRELDGKLPGFDYLKIRFQSSKDLRRGDLVEFIREHKDLVTKGKS